jgi:hypothetical protein
MAIGGLSFYRSGRRRPFAISDLKRRTTEASHGKKGSGGENQSEYFSVGVSTIADTTASAAVKFQPPLHRQHISNDNAICKTTL